MTDDLLEFIGFDKTKDDTIYIDALRVDNVTLFTLYIRRPSDGAWCAYPMVFVEGDNVEAAVEAQVRAHHADDEMTAR